MKNLSEAGVMVLSFIAAMFLFCVVVFGADAYTKYLETYNNQQNKIISQKLFENVLDCRQKVNAVNASPSYISANLDKVCGEVPSIPYPVS